MMIVDDVGIHYFKDDDCKIRHRTNGPALIYNNNDVLPSWYINGRLVTTNKEYQEATGLSDEDMLMFVLKCGDVTF